MDSQTSMRLALTGDSMITRSTAASRSESVAGLIKLIRDADVAFTNLEVLPNDFRGYPAVESGGTHLAAHHRVVDDLTDMGFNLFSCANNHALDYSIEGLLATIEVLEQKEVSYAGIGRTLAQARMPVYVDRAGGGVAMVSCSSTFAKGQSAGEQRPEVQGRPGLNPLRFETIYEVTREQLETLQEIFSALGLEQQWREWIQLGFAFPPEDPQIFPFLDTNLRSAGLLNARFRAADHPAVKTTLNVQDVEEIARWTREARARADVVLVSLHAHEQDATIEDPAEFIRAFAHRVVDEGADIVIGHGPHLLRGMEIYRRSVIFYSLGNFIAQNELVNKLPADSYEYFRVDSSKTPSELFQIRHQNDQKGFPADKRFWQTIMPVCDFENGRLRRIEIVPVTLDHGQPVHRRGRPRLAEGAEAEEILTRFARLSETFGTKVEYEGKSKASDIATIEL